MTVSDDLLDLRGIGQRQDWFRFDVLDATLTRLGMVEPDGNPTISVDTTRATMRSMGGFTLPPDQGADFTESGVFIQPVFVLENGAEFPLGVFRFVDARRIRTNLGVAFEGSMGDQTVVVDVQSTTTFGIPTGGSYEAAIRQILTDRGIVDIQVDSTGTAAGTPVAYPIGTSWLRIVNELAGLMGCLPLYFETSGRARIREAPDLAALDTDDAAVSYDDGLNIFETGIIESNDLLSAPNLFVVIESGAGTTPIRGEYALPPSSPNSAFHIGYDNPRTYNEQGLPDNAAAAARARVAAITDGAVFEHVTFDGPTDPRHGVFSVVEFRGLLYLEESWSMPLTVGANMTHTLRRVYSA